MNLHIGTSGWSYASWKPAFFPEKLPSKRFLEFYATRLNAVELNATFRRMPREMCGSEQGRQRSSSTAGRDAGGNGSAKALARGVYEALVAAGEGGRDVAAAMRRDKTPRASAGQKGGEGSQANSAEFTV